MSMSTENNVSASVREMLKDAGVNTNVFGNIIHMLNCFEVYYDDINFL